MLIEGMLMGLMLVLLSIGSLLGLIYILIRVLQQPTADAGIANCGRCGYPVFGLDSMTCPECGAQFTEVGILSPSMRKRFIGPVLYVMLWTLCLFLPACLISGLLVYIGPQQTAPSEYIAIMPIDPVASNYTTIDINRSHVGSYTTEWEDEFMLGGHDFLDVDIYGQKNENNWYEIDLNTMAYDANTGSVPYGKKLTRADVESWLGSVNADLKHPDVQKQVDELYTRITQVKANGLTGQSWTHFRETSTSNWPDQRPALWFIGLQPIIWLVVYVLGIVFYVLMRTRYDRKQKLITLETIRAHELKAAAEAATSGGAETQTIGQP